MDIKLPSCAIKLPLHPALSQDFSASLGPTCTCERHKAVSDTTLFLLASHSHQPQYPMMLFVSLLGLFSIITGNVEQRRLSKKRTQLCRKGES